MTPQSFIFIGRSGCGKGTQVELLAKNLKEKESSIGVLYVQTGQEFREFIKGNALTQKKAKKIYDIGGLMPEFLTVNMWIKPLIEKYKGNQHIIFDGTPRKLHEAGVLDSVFGFYDLGKPWVINIVIGEEEALKRLLLRKRPDDTGKDIKRRLEWYESDVAPTLEFYRNNPSYNFLEINGERPVEDIHADIVKGINLV
jgi:adenylate kinase family enzyme